MKFGGHVALFSARNQHHAIQAASIIVDPGGTDRRGKIDLLQARLIGAA
jgi:hypothetical protein